MDIKLQQYLRVEAVPVKVQTGGALASLSEAEGMVTALEGQKLAWVRPNRLRDYPMPPADEPLVSHLMALL